MKTTHLLLILLLPAVCCGVEPMGFNNPFYSMDTYLRDYPGTPVEQAALLKELGYAGYGASFQSPLPEMADALAGQGLRMYTMYVPVKINADGFSWDDNLEKLLPCMQQHHTTLWVMFTSDTWKPSDSAGDAQAVAAMEKLLELAQPYGLTISMYPHFRCWLERVEDGVRLAEKMNRPEVGVTINLCHWLRCTKGEGLDKLLQQAAPWLSVATINGADPGDNWDSLIQPLGSGAYDVQAFLVALKNAGYVGPIGLQGYGVKGDSRENLKTSMTAWNRYSAGFAGEWVRPLDAEGFSAFREPTGDWLKAARVFLNPDDQKKLAWEGDGLEAVNGPEGHTKHLITQYEHGDLEAHVEFMVPQGSNSGVYFEGRYEIQVLDSWGVTEPGHYDCGGIYQRFHEEPGLEESERGYEGRPPRINAAKQPGEWQTYDVIFRAPRFNEAGEKTAPAEFVSVLHNGVLVHARRTVSGPTRAAVFMDEKPQGPVMFQGDHGPVAYRNILLRPLPPGSPAGE